MNRQEIIAQRMLESILTKERIRQKPDILAKISELADAMIDTLQSGHKILLCGNGGSASDALHIAGEIVGRFQQERRAWPAVVLNADVATMTAIANDYGYNQIFARQVEGQINSGDILIGLSTSGNSTNVCEAIKAASKNGGKTAVLTGGDGGKAAKLADYAIIVPSDNTARIQECHITIGHIVCELAEDAMIDA